MGRIEEQSPDTVAHAVRASSFGAQAFAYAELRPSYPDSAVRWALDPVADRADRADRDVRGLRVLDLAAGTGKLTEVLVRLGVDVIAVEPDAAMVGELRRRVPGVRAVSGRAEEIPLPADAFDAVLVGQAWHWFDLARALPEIGRVLRSRGVVAGLWNFEDDQPDWVVGFSHASESPGTLARWRDTTAFPDHEAFEQADRAEFGHVQRHTVETAVALVATHSNALIMTDHDRAQLLARVEGYLRERPETAAGEFDLPMVTGVVRAVRA